MAAQTFPLETICKLLDLTPQSIARLVNDGIIPRHSRGRYELVPCVRGYIKFLRERALKGDASSVSGDLTSHRTRLTAARADLAEMEKAQMENSLIPAEDIASAWEAMTSNMRSKMLAIPSKAAPAVYAADNLNEAKSILKDEINEALAELSGIEIRTRNPVISSKDGGSGASDDGDIDTTAESLGEPMG